MTTTLTATTGRIWGYTDEVDTVERIARQAFEKTPAVTFTVTNRKVIGSRGWFTRRLVSKYEYAITAPTHREVVTAGQLIDTLADAYLS